MRLAVLTFSLLTLAAGAPQFPLGSPSLGRSLTLGTPALPDSFLANLKQVAFIPQADASVQSSVVAEETPSVPVDETKSSIPDQSLSHDANEKIPEDVSIPVETSIPEVSPKVSDEALIDPITNADENQEIISLEAKSEVEIPVTKEEKVTPIEPVAIEKDEAHIQQTNEEEKDKPVILSEITDAVKEEISMAAVNKEGNEEIVIVDSISPESGTAEIKENLPIQESKIEEPVISIVPDTADEPVIEIKLEENVLPNEKEGRSISVDALINKLDESLSKVDTIQSPAKTNLEKELAETDPSMKSEDIVSLISSNADIDVEATPTLEEMFVKEENVDTTTLIQEKPTDNEVEEISKLDEILTKEANIDKPIIETDVEIEVEVIPKLDIILSKTDIVDEKVMVHEEQTDTEGVIVQNVDEILTKEDNVDKTVVEQEVSINAESEVIPKLDDILIKENNEDKAVVIQEESTGKEKVEPKLKEILVTEVTVDKTAPVQETPTDLVVKLVEKPITSKVDFDVEDEAKSVTTNLAVKEKSGEGLSEAKIIEDVPNIELVKTIDLEVPEVIASDMEAMLTDIEPAISSLSPEIPETEIIVEKEVEQIKDLEVSVTMLVSEMVAEKKEEKAKSDIENPVIGKSLVSLSEVSDVQESVVELPEEILKESIIVEPSVIIIEDTKSEANKKLTSLRKKEILSSGIVKKEEPKDENIAIEIIDTNSKLPSEKIFENIPDLEISEKNNDALSVDNTVVKSNLEKVIVDDAIEIISTVNNNEIPENGDLGINDEVMISNPIPEIDIQVNTYQKIIPDDISSARETVPVLSEIERISVMEEPTTVLVKEDIFIDETIPVISDSILPNTDKNEAIEVEVKTVTNDQKPDVEKIASIVVEEVAMKTGLSSDSLPIEKEIIIDSTQTESEISEVIPEVTKEVPLIKEDVVDTEMIDLTPEQNIPEENINILLETEEIIKMPTIHAIEPKILTDEFSDIIVKTEISKPSDPILDEIVVSELVEEVVAPIDVEEPLVHITEEEVVNNDMRDVKVIVKSEAKELPVQINEAIVKKEVTVEKEPKPSTLIKEEIIIKEDIILDGPIVQGASLVDSIITEPLVEQLSKKSLVVDITPEKELPEIVKAVEVVPVNEELTVSEKIDVVASEPKQFPVAIPEVNSVTDTATKKKEEQLHSTISNSIISGGKSLSSAPHQQQLSLNKFSFAHEPVVRTFGFGTLTANSAVAPLPVLYNGAFVDPRTLVAPRFRQYIYSNDASDVVAAKVALFRLHSALRPQGRPLPVKKV